VSPMRYEQGFYIPEDGVLHSHRRENLKSYVINDVHRNVNCFKERMQAGNRAYFANLSTGVLVALTTVYRQKSALTSPLNCGRSVGIVREQTKSHGV
jgi:hypothetical protein